MRSNAWKTPNQNVGFNHSSATYLQRARSASATNLHVRTWLFVWAGFGTLRQGALLVCSLVHICKQFPLTSGIRSNRGPITRKDHWPYQTRNPLRKSVV